MLQEEDLSDPWRKRPVGEENKKKKKGPVLETLMTATRIRIPVSLTKEKERQQLREMLQRSTVERRASNIP